MSGAPLTLTGCEATPVGLKFNGGVTLAEWDEIGEKLAWCESYRMWLIGDWIIYGQANFPNDKLLEAKCLSGFEWKTLYNAKYVCSNVSVSVRTEKLSFDHHLRVAHLESAEQQKWLGIAAQHKWSVRKLRLCISEWSKWIASVTESTGIAPSASERIRAIGNYILTDEQCDLLTVKTGGVVGFTNLCSKLKLALARTPEIEKLGVPDLIAAHQDLQPFIEVDHRIMSRLEELGHGTR